MKQETAVEWFVRQLIYIIDAKEAMNEGLDEEDIKYYGDLAKKREEAQIKDVWDRGRYVGEIFPQRKIEDTFEQDSDQYFNEKYKK